MILKNKFIPILILFLIIAGCNINIKSPVMPIWDVSFNVPLINRTEVLSERIKGTSGIFIDSSTNYLLIKFDSSHIETMSLDELFRDTIKYENHFSFKPQDVDTLVFESFVSDDSVFLEEFHLYKGTINYDVTNYLNRKIDLTVIIPGFTRIISGSTDTLKFKILVPPYSSARRSIDLSNFRYRQTENPFGGFRYGFYIKGYVKIDSGYSGDSVYTRVELKNLGFNYLKGKIKPYEVEIKPQTKFLDIDQDIKNILPKVQLYGAKVLISPNITVRNLEVKLKDFEIIGSYKTFPNKKNLKIKNHAVLDTVISLDQKTIEVNIDDFDIYNFLNPEFPDSITYKGKLILNPLYKGVDIALPDSLSFDVRLQLYSSFRINSVSRSDTFDINLDDEFKDQLDRFLNANIELDINNGLPIGFEITGYFLDSLSQKLFYFTREIGNGSPADTIFSIIAAQIDNEGKVISSVNQKKVIALIKEEMEKLKRVKKAIISVILYTSEGRKVLFTADNRITVKVNCSVSFQVRSG